MSATAVAAPKSGVLQSWPIREQVGRDWADELLSFDASFGVGVRNDTRLVMAWQGGALPTQISDVRRYGDGSIASARVWCRLTLGAGKRGELELREGPVAAVEGSPFWKLREGGFVAGNGLFSVNVPASGVFVAGAAPGWVESIRIGDATVGEGRLVAPVSITLHTELLDQGPLFVRWRSSAHGETRLLASVECTIHAGEDFVRISETSSRDSSLVFHLNLMPGLAPDRLLTKGGGEHIEQNVRVLDHGRAEELAVIDFHSGHHQMSLSWGGLYHAKPQALAMADGPFIGAIELDGWTWTNLSYNRIRVITSPPESPGSLSIVSPLPGGAKTWALVCSTVGKNVKTPGDQRFNHLCAIKMKWADVPLQKVKDWVLEWDDAAARPLLQSGAGSIEAARKRVKDDADLTRAYRALAAAAASGEYGANCSALTTTWAALGDEQVAQQAGAKLESEIRTAIDQFWSMGGYMRLIIFTGRSMKQWFQAYDLLKAAGLIPAQIDKHLRRDMAFLSYCFADPQYFPHHRNLMDHHDPDSWMHPGGLGDWMGDAMCPPNFHTEYYTTFGMFGCCFREHPMAATWRDEGAKLMDRQLEVHFYDSGVYCESPNYHSHVFTMINQFALALRRAGGRDFFQHPRFKAQFEYWCRLATPPIALNDAAKEFVQPYRYLDADLPRYSMIPSNGNTGHDCSDHSMLPELAIGAAVYKESDPGLSQGCMTIWRRGGRVILTHYNDLTFLLVAESGLPGAAGDKIGQASEVLTGSFVTFRGNSETDDEVFVLTKNGTATHHNDFDEGGFTIWAYGAPIASDFGYHGKHEGKSHGVGATRQHNCVEFDGKSSGYLGIEKTSPPEKWVSTPAADLLVSYLPITNFRDMTPGSGTSYMDQVPAQRIEYRRYTLFVKPHYMIVLDSIERCVYAHKWWLHAQASDVKIDGPRVRFTGRFGTDLIAHFVTPESPHLTAGEWGVMRHIYAQSGLAKDYRVLVAPARPGQDFEVSGAASGRVVFVKTPAYRDTVLLAHLPFKFEDEGIAFEGKAAVVRRWADGRVEKTLLDGSRLEER